MQSLNEFNYKGNMLMQKLNDLSKLGNCVNLLNEINRMTLDVIAKVAFDLDTDSLNNPESKLNNYVCRGLEAVTLQLTDPLCYLKPSRRNHVNKLRESIRNLRHFSIESLNTKLKEMEENNFISKNILSLMIKNLSIFINFLI